MKYKSNKRRSKINKDLEDYENKDNYQSDKKISTEIGNPNVLLSNDIKVLEDSIKCDNDKYDFQSIDFKYCSEKIKFSYEMYKVFICAIKPYLNYISELNGIIDKDKIFEIVKFDEFIVRHHYLTIITYLKMEKCRKYVPNFQNILGITENYDIILENVRGIRLEKYLENNFDLDEIYSILLQAANALNIANRVCNFNHLNIEFTVEKLDNKVPIKLYYIKNADMNEQEYICITTDIILYINHITPFSHPDYQIEPNRVKDIYDLFLIIFRQHIKNEYSGDAFEAYKHVNEDAKLNVLSEYFKNLYGPLFSERLLSDLIHLSFTNSKDENKMKTFYIHYSLKTDSILKYADKIKASSKYIHFLSRMYSIKNEKCLLNEIETKSVEYYKDDLLKDLSFIILNYINKRNYKLVAQLYGVMLKKNSLDDYEYLISEIKKYKFILNRGQINFDKFNDIHYLNKFTQRELYNKWLELFNPEILSWKSRDELVEILYEYGKNLGIAIG